MNSTLLLRPRPAPRGVVLLLALILLIALSLAGVAMVRSVSTTTSVAGNLAFKQSATHAGNLGIESAITWLTSVSPATLNANVTTGANRYLATRSDPAAGQTWAQFWATLPPAAINTLPQDPNTGNTVSYVVQRLCGSTGVPSSASCSISPIEASSEGNSQGAGVVQLRRDPQVYYRITARVAGPRDTVSFVQAVVAL